jgi:hypothetical protein
MAPLYLALSIPVINILGAISSLIAAFYWYRASQVVAPPNALFGVGPFTGAYYGNGSNFHVNASPLVEYAQESGRRNKIAAWWSAAHGGPSHASRGAWLPRIRGGCPSDVLGPRRVSRTGSQSSLAASSRTPKWLRCTASVTASKPLGWRQVSRRGF